MARGTGDLRRSDATDAKKGEPRGARFRDPDLEIIGYFKLRIYWKARYEKDSVGYSDPARAAFPVCRRREVRYAGGRNDQGHAGGTRQRFLHPFYWCLRGA